MSSSLALDHLASGKVREIYDAGDGRLLLVASDRISAFDVVLPTPIPDKGRVLNGALAALVRADGRHRAQPRDLGEARATSPRARAIPISPGARCSCDSSRCCRSSASCAATWRAPAGRTTAAPAPVCGIPLPEGLREADKLPQTLFTPSTKATEGHDENITRRRRASSSSASSATARSSAPRSRCTSAPPPPRCERGIILADTKFEFGIDGDGALVVGDEVLTPDSSRFWPADSYAPGSSPPSFDKQYVRDWLETQDWDKTPPGPELPDEVRDGTAARYREAYERLAGRPFASYLDEMGVRA